MRAIFRKGYSRLWNRRHVYTLLCFWPGSRQCYSSMIFFWMGDAQPFCSSCALSDTTSPLQILWVSFPASKTTPKTPQLPSFHPLSAAALDNLLLESRSLLLRTSAFFHRDNRHSSPFLLILLLCHSFSDNDPIFIFCPFFCFAYHLT